MTAGSLRGQRWNSNRGLAGQFQLQLQLGVLKARQVVVRVGDGLKLMTCVLGGRT